MIFNLVRYTVLAFLFEVAMLIPTIFILQALGRQELKLYTVYADGQTKEEGSLNPKDWFEGFLSVKNLIFPRKSNERPKEQKVIVDRYGIQLSIAHYVYYLSVVMLVLSELLLGVELGVLYVKQESFLLAIQSPMWLGILISFIIWVAAMLISRVKVKKIQKVMLVNKSFMVSVSFYFQHHDKEHYMENVQFMDAVRRMMTPAELNEVIKASTEYEEGKGQTTDADKLIEEFFNAMDKKKFNGSSWIHQLSFSGQQAYRRIKESLQSSSEIR